MWTKNCWPMGFWTKWHWTKCYCTKCVWTNSTTPFQMNAILKFDFQKKKTFTFFGRKLSKLDTFCMWQLHFPYNKGKQEEAVDPLYSALKNLFIEAGHLCSYFISIQVNTNFCTSVVPCHILQFIPNRCVKARYQTSGIRFSDSHGGQKATEINHSSRIQLDISKYAMIILWMLCGLIQIQIQRYQNLPL